MEPGIYSFKTDHIFSRLLHWLDMGIAYLSLCLWHKKYWKKFYPSNKLFDVEIRREYHVLTVTTPSRVMTSYGSRLHRDCRKGREMP